MTKFKSHRHRLKLSRDGRFFFILSFRIKFVIRVHGRNMHFIIKNNMGALQEICKTYNVRRLYIFGSASTGTFDEMQSDIDLIVELDKMDPIQKGKILLELWDKFETLFSRRVDLLSSPQVRNPYLQKGIDSTRKLIYEA